MNSSNEKEKKLQDALNKLNSLEAVSYTHLTLPTS